LGERPGRPGIGAGTTTRSNCSTSQSFLRTSVGVRPPLDAGVDGDPGSRRSELDGLEERHRDLDLALQGRLGRELSGTKSRYRGPLWKLL